MNKTISFLLLMVVVLFSTVHVAYALDCGCDENGPQYQNKAEIQPNK